MKTYKYMYRFICVFFQPCPSRSGSHLAFGSLTKIVAQEMWKKRRKVWLAAAGAVDGRRLHCASPKRFAVFVRRFARLWSLFCASFHLCRHRGSAKLQPVLGDEGAGSEGFSHDSRLR